VAQIEDVATLPAFRNRGLARAVVLEAAALARASGAELVFLVADENDWPKDLYGRLGFDQIGVEHVFGRSGRQHLRA
jgi:predicted GNAT family acetyltransferase